MDMIKFLSKRKKENRQSLIIDNINIDSLREQFSQRRNSLSSDSNSLAEPQMPTTQNEMPTTQNEMPTTQNEIPTTQNEIPTTQNEMPTTQNEMPKSKYKETEILKEDISNTVRKNMIDKPILSSIQESEYYNSNVYSFEDTHPVHANHTKSQECDDHKCNLCHNKNQIKDGFMILTCGHIFHIRCLVDSHYTDANKCGIIDEEYFNSRICCVCSNQMEMEDILYIHNKFYRNTKEYIVKQDETIEKLDKQMSKLKEELRVCYEYKQRLEHQREKSRQITVTINTMM